MRSSNLSAWKEAIQSSQEMWDNDLYSNSLTSQQKHLLNQIHLQKNSSIQTNKDNELEFLIPVGQKS